MSRFNEQRGQTIVLTTVVCLVLFGMAALVVDIGSWFRDQRDTQRIADAAALAGAQALPTDPAQANVLAAQYTTKNGGTSPAVSITSTISGLDTIEVKINRNTPGFFAKIFGIDSVNVKGRGVARVANINAARWAAPIAVDKAHPLIAGCSPGPCFGVETQLDLKKTGPGAFRLLNLDGSKGGTSPGILADWMVRGYDGYMGVDKWYYSDPGAKFNSSHMQNALTERIGEEVLFPIYDATKGNGANFEYHVVGWIGFVMTSFDAKGSSGTLSGRFTRVIWEGIQTTSGSSSDFGVRAIELIE